LIPASSIAQWNWSAKDLQTRPTFKNTRLRPGLSRSRPPGGITIYGCVTIVLLLVFPVYALIRLSASIDWRLLFGAALVISVFTFFMYRSDKQSAIDDEWRVPELMLHFFEGIGGWPGAFLAQRIVRHKISKTSYQLLFWTIVLVHQFVAVDFVIGWRLTQGVLRFIKIQAT
jgi:uncharacterized membrane protein YsdA (DUF1294 family)